VIKRFRDNDSTKSGAMEFKGKKYKFLIKSDGLKLALCYDSADKIPQCLNDEVANANRGFEGGKIKVPMISESPSE
jgi:hypothetical protein